MNESTPNDKIIKDYIMNFFLCVFFVALIISVIYVYEYPNNDDKPIEKVDFQGFSEVSKICELATLKCYYHDVAEYKKEPDGLFKYGLFQYGAKRMWMEYNGIVRVGIDVGQVKVEEPTEDGVVKIYIPEATILDIDADENTISEPIEDNGVFTEITADEKAQAFAAAQSSMKKSVEKDKNLLNQARNNAKELLKQYVMNVGKQIGQEYTVQWIEDDTIKEKDEE